MKTDVRNMLKIFSGLMTAFSVATPYFPNASLLRSILRPPAFDSRFVDFLYITICAAVLLTVWALRTKLNITSSVVALGIGIVLSFFYVQVLSAPNQALIQYGIGPSVADYFDSSNQYFAGVLYYSIFASFTGTFGILTSQI